ncbi:four-carbon acid sugar kinase family protein [Terrabacter sp. NPDC080008]|uniref:four-carbon acid sugar kinase family protein n=1 Tax=Terrabacter sp. NPDC080008 TaxID=3155176 RepID=UPI003450713C
MAELSLGIVADDLSGAAECAAHALVRVSRSIVNLTSSRPGPSPERTGTGNTSVLTVDTDSRRLDGHHAAAAVRRAATLVADAPVVVKKVDSLLRGHLAVEVAALADELHRVPVVAVTNPALGRIVRDGVLHVDGMPLHDTDLWAVEPGPVPRCVADALQPLPTVLVPHETVLRGAEAVCVELAAAAERGLVAVCDAVSERDLDVVNEAARRASAAAGSGTLVVGSGALADAAVRALPDRTGVSQHADLLSAVDAEHEAGDAPQRRDPGPGIGDAVPGVLMVLGTRAPGTTAQIAQLKARGARVLLLEPGRLLDAPEDAGARLAGLPRRGVVVVALDPAAPVCPAQARRLSDALAAAVAPHIDQYGAALLSGGETARTVLDRLGVASLAVVAELETGTVLSRRPDGRHVVTRPGSFGDSSSLVRVAERLGGLSGTPATSPAAPPAHTEPRATTGVINEENP